MTFNAGDIVTDILAQPPEWMGIVVRTEGNRVAVNVKGGDILWYPASWLRQVTRKDFCEREQRMEDTREYLQSVTGGT